MASDSTRTAKRTSTKPPRIRELPLLGITFSLVRNPLAFIEHVTRSYGDAARFHLAGREVFLFNHPDAIEQILVAERDHVIKDSLTRGLSLVLGNGLLLSEGEVWRKQRRLAQPGFHRERIAVYGDATVTSTEKAVSKFRDNESRDVLVDMMHLTLEIVATTLFGSDFVAAEGVLAHALDVFMDRYAGLDKLIPPFIPTPGSLRAKKAVKALDEVVYKIIASRRKERDRGDLLSMLIAASSEEDGRMNDTQVRDEAITLLMAGHETTALSLGFTLHLLSQHPDVVAKLVEELRTVVGDRPATAADVPKLRYAEAVIQESLRLYPPVWGIAREVISPCEIGGYPVAKGTQLWMSQWTVHRDPRWFEDPLTFRPERWANGFLKTLPRHAYFPFGGGARVCIGNTFAMMETVLVLVTLLRRFCPTSTETRTLALAPSITLRPKHGIPIVFRRTGAMFPES